MGKYTNFIFKFKKPLIIFVAVYTLFSIVGLFQLKLNTDFAIFSKTESVYEERLIQLEETFGSFNQIVIVVESYSFDETTIAELRSIQSDLAGYENVISVQGVAPEQITINNVPTDILTLSTDQLQAYYDQFGDFSPLVIKEGIYYSIYNVFINDQFGRPDIKEIETMLEAHDLPSYISGDIYNQTKIVDYILRILLILPPLALLVILLVFRWQMGAFKPTLLSVLPAGIGSVWTLGFIGWLGNEVSILTAIVPIFIIVIGSADGLHFLSHFQDSISSGKDHKTALTETLSIVGVPMIVTTLTTIAGFLSLLSMNTASTYDLSIFSSLGILLAGIATWLILPLILSGDIDVLPKKARKFHIDFSKPLRKLRGTFAFVFIGIIVGLSILMIPKISNEFNMLMIYKDSTIVAKNSEKVQEINGGSIPVYVTVDLGNTPISLASMNEINQISEDLKNLTEVSKVINPYELMQMFYNMHYLGAIPDDSTLAFIYSSVSSDDNSTINNLISTSSNEVRLLVFPSNLNNSTLETIETTAVNANPDALVTGVQYLMKDLNVNIAQMQLYSILLAIGSVFVMLVITLRSFKIALASIIPIVVTVLALYGFLGATGISLNVTTVMIFSITIGVGIDYAVHFSSVYKYYLKEGMSKDESVEKAYQNTSRPIITNALGISLGLSIMMLSPLNIHFNVSILMWVSMVVSVIVTLTLLPTLFRGKKKNI